ncbi:MAG: SOS response-associated peptidase [Hamadaea sp.]|nr:SOS response-associated peptidase [Hamadaea sp.]
MCGRYANARSRTQLAADFAIPVEQVEVKHEDYNVTPQKMAPIVLTAPAGEGEDPVRQIQLALWGLRPRWLKEDARGFANARAETLAEKRSFSKPFARGRILVPMDGFYEWFVETPEGGGKAVKQPYYFTPKDGAVLAMAGLVQYAKDPRNPDREIATYTIITTTATDDVGLVHDRMPMIIRPENWAEWLNPAMTDLDTAQALMAPPGAGLLDIFKVSTEVNKSSNNGPQLIVPLGDG